MCPYDPAGNFSLVPSYKAVPGQTIRTEQHNPPLEDIAQALSSVLVRDGRNPMVGDLNMNSFRITNLTPGTANTDGATVGQVLASGPIGTIVMYAGDNAPDGWMLCAGGALSRTSFAALFAVVGTRFGSGDGSTTFNVPDLRGRVGVGRDNMGGAAANRVTVPGSGIGSFVGAIGGWEAVALTEAQMPSHNHGGSTLPGGEHFHDGLSIPVGTAGPGNGVVQSPGASGTPTLSGRTGTAAAHTHGIPSQGSGLSHNNMPPTLILNYIIRVTA